ncbi:exopolysaccharide production repressor [Mesorhizobium sp. J18]|uniref:exopolysaccharide production repressor protein n=1 Tax=Mesorhizobium sp. J18 TaxID=935263 RepID=UPI00119B27DF|nr:exopolysaccharide production repressor protein [Mesorhizobium sp. J18]TWG90115.1 exopolysaccharide production repressor [Mesorhizobium sp. J18]
MSFMLFLRGMLLVLAVFAVATYLATQSLWLTFLYSLLIAVFLQVGYFLAILFMVWRMPAKRTQQTAPSAETSQPRKAKPAGELPGSLGH